MRQLFLHEVWLCEVWHVLQTSNPITKFDYVPCTSSKSMSLYATVYRYSTLYGDIVASQCNKAKTFCNSCEGWGPGSNSNLAFQGQQWIWCLASWLSTAWITWKTWNTQKHIHPSIQKDHISTVFATVRLLKTLDGTLRRFEVIRIFKSDWKVLSCRYTLWFCRRSTRNKAGSHSSLDMATLAVALVVQILISAWQRLQAIGHGYTLVLLPANSHG